MEQIAIISDIHGNLPALETILEEIRARDIVRIFCLGDMIGKGPSSDIVIDICNNQCEKIIKGNHEEVICSVPLEDITDDLLAKMVEWHRIKIGETRLKMLSLLENCVDIKMSGKNIRLLHASPVNVWTRVHKKDNKEKHLSMFKNTEFTGFSNVPNIVGYGDIHSSYIEIIGEKILFNVGSVGNPLGKSTKASFGIITGEYNSSTNEKLEIEIVKIEYDKDKAVMDAKESNLPGIELYIEEILTGIYRR